ncbi:MAG: hypothetical protein Q3M24_09050 [Candidatus Electrothrix aestuarii]|uniref:Lipoprotein n=1 Tax=Candidatus Electrothrix aestuarii TaxID=3062594 RepID=A0AAU8M1F2_9BACT|nr:hypothetical protein [Candidatus Electrothrix aestuarii]
MMRVPFLLPILILLAGSLSLTACGGKQTLPLLTETTFPSEKAAACTAIFPQGAWQFVHSIDFTLKHGGGSTVIGVTSLSPDSLECALVTPEGFTLFSGTLDQKNNFKITRAVPPFDKPSFAQGLLEDLQAIFRKPVGELQQGALGEPPAPVCRYHTSDKRVTDILPDKNAETCWQVRNYAPDQKLTRSITARSCQTTEAGSGLDSIPQDLELQTYGATGYLLKMHLISAEHLE